MKIGTQRKLKFKKMKRLLGLADWQVTGVLQSVWNCCVENCPQGDIGKFSNEDIASLIEWDGDADQLVNALVDCGWLDESERYRLVVHDWHEHAPNYVKANLKSRGLPFASIIPEKPSEPLSESPGTGLSEPPGELPRETLSTPPTSQVNSSKVNSSQVIQAPPQPLDFDGLDIEQVKATATRIVKRMPRRVEGDRDFIWQVSVLSTAGYSEDWIESAMDGLYRSKTNVVGYLRAVLQENAAKLFRSFEDDIRSIPKYLRRAPPNELASSVSAELGMRFAMAESETGTSRRRQLHWLANEESRIA